MAYKSNKQVQEIKEPESEPNDDKLNSNHFWMLFVDPVAKEIAMIMNLRKLSWKKVIKFIPNILKTS